MMKHHFDTKTFVKINDTKIFVKIVSMKHVYIAEEFETLAAKCANLASKTITMIKPRSYPQTQVAN
jgi:hypothetical protein